MFYSGVYVLMFVYENSFVLKNCMESCVINQLVKNVVHLAISYTFFKTLEKKLKL